MPTRVIVLTAAEDDRDVCGRCGWGARRGVEAVRHGPAGQSIHRVHAGEIWLDNRMTRR